MRKEKDREKKISERAWTRCAKVYSTMISYLRIAHANIVFKQLWPVCCEHEAPEEHADKRSSFLRKRLNSSLNDARRRCLQLRCEAGTRRIGPHAACVGAFVPIECLLYMFFESD